jgi:hypothetical protein
MKDIDKVVRDLVMGSCPLPESWMAPLFSFPDRNLLCNNNAFEPAATCARVAKIIAALSDKRFRNNQS